MGRCVNIGKELFREDLTDKERNFLESDEVGKFVRDFVFSGQGHEYETYLEIVDIIRWSPIKAIEMEEISKALYKSLEARVGDDETGQGI